MAGAEVAAQAPRPRVAIVPGIAVGLDAAKVDALSQDMAEALSAELLVDAVGGLEIRRRLPAEGVPPDCLAKPTCTEDVAKRLDATQLLFVVMVDAGSGGAVQVDTTWVEPATGRSAARPAIDITGTAEARARFAAAARSLLPDAPVKPVARPGGGVHGKMTPAVPRHLTTPTIVAGTAALVGLGAGVALGLRSRSSYRDCEARTTGAGCSQSEKDSIRRTSLFADVGFVVAVGGAVTAAILFATSGKESHLVVEPAAAGGGLSLGYTGRF
ncbi:MAG: hypothetical protein KF773_06975 [Deltaproteobacteria bacterium]|nr:hypothetical protein [Deltaproteobacteria bacterium]